MKRKVLISAYACEPGRGSEPGVGWNLVRELSTAHELTVVTRLNNREIIEGCDEVWVRNVRWIFIDPPKRLTFWKRKGRGVQAFYLLWQLTLRKKVRELLKDEQFDVFHHLTFGKYWVPSGLANLGVPMVFGPVGGGEATPVSLVPNLPLRAKVAERAREVLKWVIWQTPGVRALYRSCDWSIAVTHQTADALRRMGLTAISVLPQSGIRASDLNGVEEDVISSEERCQPAGRVRLISACRLIYWKGMDLAIRAVKEARDMGVDVELTILQEGPEKGSLESLVRDLDLGDFVRFTGRLPGLEDVYRAIQSADALIHPAYHEAFGQSCLESLALGVPVLCLDWGGPAVIVDDQTGIRVPPSTYPETVRNLAEAIGLLSSKVAAGDFRAESCQKRAFTMFSWERLAQSISDVYEEIT